MSASHTGGPPRLAEWLLAGRLRSADRPMVLGDLREQFHRQVASAGAGRAVFWYWRETVRLLVQFKPMTTIEAGVLDDMAPQRFGMTVMGALGAIALLLSVLGTYVLAESMATMRRREMGIRAALGASGRHLRMVLLFETLRLVGAGLILGFALCWLGAGTIRAFLFQVEPFDPIVTGGVAALVVVLAVLVSLRPAFAAARVDLARVLRED